MSLSPSSVGDAVRLFKNISIVYDNVQIILALL